MCLWAAPQCPYGMGEQQCGRCALHSHSPWFCPAPAASPEARCIIVSAVHSRTGFTRRVWGLGHAVRPTTVSKEPRWIWRRICVNTSVCWTSSLSGRDWKRQRYELIYLCDLLWLSLFLMPNTPCSFQDRPRLTAFWEDTKMYLLDHLAKPSSHISTAEPTFNNIRS